MNELKCSFMVYVYSFNQFESKKFKGYNEHCILRTGFRAPNTASGSKMNSHQNRFVLKTGYCATNDAAGGRFDLSEPVIVSALQTSP